jgi:hypothetical protein
LPRIIRRNVAPISAATKPVTRLVFFMHSPPTVSRPRIIVTGKPGSFPPSLLVQVECDRRGKPDRVNVSAVPPSSNIKDGATKFEHRQVCSKILCGEKDPLCDGTGDRELPSWAIVVHAQQCM